MHASESSLSGVDVEEAALQEHQGSIPLLDAFAEEAGGVNW